MYIHKEKLLGFCAHPRTGSRTLRNRCQDVGFKEQVAHHAGPDRVHYELLEGLTYFCMIRNHWDAVCSWWHFKSGFLEEKFISAEWITNLVHGNPQYFKPSKMWWFLEVPDIIVLRYENYDQDIERLFQRFDLELHDTPSVTDNNKYVRDRNYRRYYDIGAEKVVEELFSDEILQLGYTWND